MLYQLKKCFQLAFLSILCFPFFFIFPDEAIINEKKKQKSKQSLKNKK